MRFISSFALSYSGFGRIVMALALCLGLGLTHAPAQAQGVTPRPGIDYDLLQPAQNALTASGKLDIVEFFSYMCPHCAHLEPVLALWEKALPADTAFRRVPVAFRPQWQPTARLYYALSELGALPALHARVFAAVHSENINLQSDQAIIDWVAKNGIAREKITQAMRSFSTDNGARRSAQEVQAFDIQGVPNLVIGGKYKVPGKNFDGKADILGIASYFVFQARKENGLTQTSGAAPKKKK